MTAYGHGPSRREVVDLLDRIEGLALRAPPPARIAALLRPRWTVRLFERDDDGRYHVLTVDELDGFVVAARTEEELAREFWLALREYLESYLEDGEEGD